MWSTFVQSNICEEGKQSLASLSYHLEKGRKCFSANRIQTHKSPGEQIIEDTFVQFCIFLFVLIFHSGTFACRTKIWLCQRKKGQINVGNLNCKVPNSEFIKTRPNEHKQMKLREGCLALFTLHFYIKCHSFLLFFICSKIRREAAPYQGDDN
jgi:hypothetical protein